MREVSITRCGSRTSRSRKRERSIKPASMAANKPFGAQHTAGAEGFLCEPDYQSVNLSGLCAIADDPCRESGLLLLRCCLNSSGEARPRYFFVGAVLCSAGLCCCAAFAALLHAETLTSHQTRETPRGTTHVSNSKL